MRSKERREYARPGPGAHQYYLIWIYGPSTYNIPKDSILRQKVPKKRIIRPAYFLDSGLFTYDQGAPYVAQSKDTRFAGCLYV